MPSGDHHRGGRGEVVANGEGLNVLHVALTACFQRIHDPVHRYDDVTFVVADVAVICDRGLAVGRRRLKNCALRAVQWGDSTIADRGPPMPKPNYAFEKRQRDLAKKAKKEEKRQRKTGRAENPEGTDSSAPAASPSAIGVKTDS